MTLRRLSASIVVALLVGCAPPAPPLPPAPTGLDRISVQEPVNRTGDDLVVEEPGWLGRLTDTKGSTVPDVLAEDLRTMLTRRGFKVRDPSGSWPALRTEIRRWEPYSANYSLVTVDVLALLVEPDTGRELWRVERADWKVLTPDARSRREASLLASSAIAEALLETWQPAKPTPPAKKVP